MNMGNKEFHIHLDNSNKARYAIIPGDPDRVKKIAAFLENPKFIASNREYTTFEGYLSGEKILVTSTGIGGPSAAIAVEELHHIGVDTIIRVGTCGGMQPQVTGGDLIIVTGAVRMDGASKEYAPIEYPAVSDFAIAMALTDAALKRAVTFHCGIVQSKDSFYGQHNPKEMPTKDTLLDNWYAWKALGVLASEMECATVFTVAATRKMRASAVLQCLWNQDSDDKQAVLDTTLAITTAIDALKNIISKDNSL